MEEYVDILTDTGAYTGTVSLKSEAHRKGLYHPTVHIWLYTHDKQILLQKRAASKLSFPGLWDVSVAGHIGAGEDPVEAAMREMEEEIGLKPNPELLKKIGLVRSEVYHRPDYTDREFHHIYLYPFHGDPQTLSLQASEVSDVKLIAFAEYRDQQKLRSNKEVNVPFHKDYLSLIEEALNRLLN